MTPGLVAWATRYGRSLADRHRADRRARGPSEFFAREIRKGGPLLGGVLRPDVERAFLARLAELERERRR